MQCQQYESHNADLREKKRSYLERLKAVSILVSQQVTFRGHAHFDVARSEVPPLQSLKIF